MRLQFIGSGDAFGSGGRFNTCLHLTGERSNLLIDCGASSLVAMKRAGIDRGAIDTLLITHFHADHFGGVPFFILDQQFNIKRTKPLLIAGPPGLPGWFERAMSTAFPGERQLPFPLALREVEIGKDNAFPEMRVTPFHVVHDDRAGPCLAYRIEIEGKVICYSGDTEWTDALIEAAQGADLRGIFLEDRREAAARFAQVGERSLEELRGSAEQRVALFAAAGVRAPLEHAQHGRVIPVRRVNLGERVPGGCVTRILGVDPLVEAACSGDLL